MSNPKRVLEKNCIYHIYNRSIDKKTIFLNDSDYSWFLNKADYYKDKYGIKIIAFALLPTHFHFILRESTSEVNISKFVGCLVNSYVKHFNYLRGRKGGLFESKFKSKFVGDDDYLYTLINYINNNAVKHKIVNKPQQWDFTSYWDYKFESKYSLIDEFYVKNYNLYYNDQPKQIGKNDDLEFSTSEVD